MVQIMESGIGRESDLGSKPTEEASSKIENPEQERRVEIVQGLRDKYGILFISLMPPELMSARGITSDQEWFRDALGLPVDASNLRTINGLADKLPDRFEETGIIIGGSPYSVYEAKDEPWMQQLQIFIREMHRRQVPMLGVCFGHQLIATAFGGKVEKNPKGWEFGTVNVDLSEEGATDPLFQGMPRSFVASQAHQDVVVELPETQELEMVLSLARNDMSVFQALGYGETTRSVQFHPELDAGRIKSSARRRLANGYMNEEDFEKILPTLRDTPEARMLLSNFVVNFVLKRKQR